jgi:hypothetical protein
MGVDVDSVAVAIARAKLTTTTATELVERCASLLRGGSRIPQVPTGEFWDLAYEATTLSELSRLRQALLTQPDDRVNIALRALVLGILHGPTGKHSQTYLSNQMPRTYATKPTPAVRYWRKHGMKPPRVNVLAAVERRAKYLLAKLPPPVEGVVYQGDARELASMDYQSRVSWTITSPPYLGMRTYRPDQWLRHWFLGGQSQVEYERPNSLPSTPLSAFVAGLAETWAALARVSNQGASLVIRFGALPSVPADPAAVLLDSLVASNRGWQVLEVRPAGVSSTGRRQAKQMGRGGTAVAEIDVHARLVE